MLSICFTIFPNFDTELVTSCLQWACKYYVDLLAEVCVFNEMNESYI